MKISYDSLFKTIKDKRISTFELTEKHKISSRVIDCLRHNKNLNIHTIAILCQKMQCSIIDEVTEITIV